IEHVSGWLFRVARNRIADLFREAKTDSLSDAAVENADGEALSIEDLLPSADAGPEAQYARRVLLDELALALSELPPEQREVFVAVGGTIVRLLWNWLMPGLFGWPVLGFWQALGLLALCRILFGGLGGGGGSRYRSRSRMRERCGEMSPEERERLADRLRGRWG